MVCCTCLVFVSSCVQGSAWEGELILSADVPFPPRPCGKRYNGCKTIHRESDNSAHVLFEHATCTAYCKSMLRNLSLRRIELSAI